MSIPDLTARIAGRFRGFLPVVVDVETGGFNANSDALLELAAVLVEMTPGGELRLGATHRYHIQPFHGSRIDPAALAVNGIDPYHPLRPAMPEKEALTQLFREVRKAVRDAGCTRAILVGHNASFDLGFLNAAAARADIKRNPFHPFSSFDTATLGGVALGQTVLSRAVERLYVIAVRGAEPQLAARAHLDQHRGKLEQGVGICVEPAGLDVDHHGQEATEAARDARGEFRHAHSVTRRQPTVPPARNGTSSSPPKG